MSRTNLKATHIYLKERLSCQQLKAVYKPTIGSSLTPSFLTTEDVDSLDIHGNSSTSKISKKITFLITLVSLWDVVSRLNSLPLWGEGGRWERGVSTLITQSHFP